jgi:phenylpropionate dioxygenase-like ring-hydroxylating dioxygenase large terminal subunit
MQREEQIRVIKGLMTHLDNDTNVDTGAFMRVPVSNYTSSDLAEREWTAFFQNYPNLLGMSADLPEPGSFFTSEALGKPILCTRDQDGTFRAFLNVCRHRGTIVENQKRGKKHLFSCPFHAWGYSATGDLVAVPKESHFGNVDKSCHNLVALPAVERHGLLWVSADPQGKFDIDELLGDLGDELAGWHLTESQLQWEARYDTPMNWKLAIDTFGETYHFNALHKDTLASTLYGNCQMYDTYNRNHRMALCVRSIDHLRELPESEWHVLKAALPVYYIFPNIQLILGQNGPTLVRVYPRGADPHDSFSEISFYTNSFTQDKGWEDPENVNISAVQRAQGFAEVIQAEDYAAAASSHKGALSGAQEYVTFGRNEAALHHYHRTYSEALNLPPPEVIAAAS